MLQGDELFHSSFLDPADEMTVVLLPLVEVGMVLISWIQNSGLARKKDAHSLSLRSDGISEVCHDWTLKPTWALFPVLRAQYMGKIASTNEPFTATSFPDLAYFFVLCFLLEHRGRGIRFDVVAIRFHGTEKPTIEPHTL